MNEKQKKEKRKQRLKSCLFILISIIFLLAYLFYSRLSFSPSPKSEIDNIKFPVFQLPPPAFSKIHTYDLRSIRLSDSIRTIGAFNDKLTNILYNAGYSDDGYPRFKYFQLKEDDLFKGYAVVTDFEKIDKLGKPLEDRFNLEMNKKEYGSITDWIFPTRLNQGYFRFFAFLITDNYYGNRRESLTKNQVFEELSLGATKLHPLIEAQYLEFNSSFHVLVYEYAQLESQLDGRPKTLPNLSVNTHLQEASILEYLDLPPNYQDVLNYLDIQRKQNTITSKEYENYLNCLKGIKDRDADVLTEFCDTIEGLSLDNWRFRRVLYRESDQKRLLGSQWHDEHDFIYNGYSYLLDFLKTQKTESK